MFSHLTRVESACTNLFHLPLLAWTTRIVLSSFCVSGVSALLIVLVATSLLVLSRLLSFTSTWFSLFLDLLRSSSTTIWFWLGQQCPCAAFISETSFLTLPRGVHTPRSISVVSPDCWACGRSLTKRPRQHRDTPCSRVSSHDVALDLKPGSCFW